MLVFFICLKASLRPIVLFYFLCVLCVCAHACVHALACEGHSLLTVLLLHPLLSLSLSHWTWNSPTVYIFWPVNPWDLHVSVPKHCTTVHSRCTADAQHPSRFFHGSQGYKLRSSGFHSISPGPSSLPWSNHFSFPCRLHSVGKKGCAVEPSLQPLCFVVIFFLWIILAPFQNWKMKQWIDSLNMNGEYTLNIYSPTWNLTKFYSAKGKSLFIPNRTS